MRRYYRDELAVSQHRIFARLRALAALPILYDAAACERRFLELWPAGSDAHRSYFERIRGGPEFELAA
ncbi:MAG: hypothetical protein OEO84_08485 [Betaproteobacteria bacterium]|nr:hypothetical protein [Betaproteobacteria bacterium]